ncbi:MAG: type II secretion system secretin GspD [Pseudohongiellaceae bacterium]
MQRIITHPKAQPLAGRRRPDRLLALAVLGLVLSSCSTLQSPQGPAAGGSSQPASTPATGPATISRQATIPVEPDGDDAEQQALIDAINRDGQALEYPGFREEAPQPVTVAGEDVVELNYEQADLRLVLEELADALDITLVLDPAIDNRVSIRTAADRPLQRDDIWPLIRLLTRDAGIVLEQEGNVYNARRLPENLPVEITTPELLGEGGAARVLQVTPLTYVSTEAAAEVLAPLLQPDGSISQLGNRDLLLISGNESQLRRANELLMLLDADPFSNQGIQLYQLGNANAVEVATELEEIITMIEGPNPAYQVRGIERINALLVTAPAARGFDEIGRWVRILDASDQEQTEQLFTYRVKNLLAMDLAQTLTNVFEQDEEENQPRQSNADNNQPVSRQLIQVQDGDDAMFTTAPVPGQEAVSANLTVRIVADEATNSLLIRGTARDYRQLLTTISQLDEVPLQVMVNAVIAQITLNDDTRFGVDWSRVAANADLRPTSTETSTSFTPNLNGLLFTKSFLDGAARVDATLEAIASNNDVRLLARPSLTVSNNQEGQIEIGADVPVNAGTTFGQGGQSTTNIQYRQTGIILGITPQINSDGVVNLIITQELSSIDSAASGVQGNPTFNSQNITTTVVVRSGENVVLGGLIQNEDERLNTGIPGLNRIPVLGNLFSYQQRNNERRELFIVLRPEVINLNEQSGVQYSAVLARFELVSELFEEYDIPR